MVIAAKVGLEVLYVNESVQEDKILVPQSYQCNDDFGGN